MNNYVVFFVSILSQKGDEFISQSTARTLIAVIGLTVCLVALIKWYFSGGVCKSKARLDGKSHNGDSFPVFLYYRFTVTLILKRFSYCYIQARLQLSQVQTLE